MRSKAVRNYDMPPGNATCEAYQVLAECIQADIPVALVPIPSEHEAFEGHKIFCLPAKKEYGFVADDDFKKELGDVMTNSVEQVPGMISTRVAVQAAEQAKEIATDASLGLFEESFEEDDDEEVPEEWAAGFNAGVESVTEVDEDGTPKLWSEGFEAGRRSLDDELDSDE